MKPVQPPIVNVVFTAPEGMDPSQVKSLCAFKGTAPPGTSLDGAEFSVVAWLPTPEELEILNAGGPVYLSCLGGPMPHFLTTSFREATLGLER